MAQKLQVFFMYSIKRIEKRIKKNLLVYRDNGSFELLGVSANISKNGLFIESPYTIALDGEILLAVAIEKELFKIKGEIKWLKTTDDKYPEHIPAGMGIRITEAPAEYLNYVEYIRHQDNGI
jgi:Tfp pilus assembly protein PilZ